jgi:hypothetical protein
MVEVVLLACGVVLPGSVVVVDVVSDWTATGAPVSSGTAVVVLWVVVVFVFAGLSGCTAGAVF